MLDLGRGDLVFAGKGAAGDREIDVGMGKVQLATGGDVSYSKLEVNVGLGSFHDERPNGTKGHLAVAREFTGTGKGSIEVNVGMGRVELVE